MHISAFQPRDWHLPKFGAALCGDMTDVERLGLPRYYVAGRLDKKIAQAYQDCLGLSAMKLIDIMQSERLSLPERIAAGNLISLTGDSRLSTLQPDMITVEGGEVQLGLAFEDVDKVLLDFAELGLKRSWIEKECPAYSANLQSYRIAKYPVTNQEYRDFLLATGYPEIPSSWDFRRYPLERANHPVFTVSPQAADDYVKWLSGTTGRAFCLPTEAQWEWAASGSNRLEFPWGNVFDADLANTAESGIFTTTPVGVFLGGESPFGLSDMAGNVEEYVADSYQPYPGGHLVVDHLTEIHGAYRVARGGSFARFRDLLRTRRRHGHNPKSPTYAMGFRVAETL